MDAPADALSVSGEPDPRYVERADPAARRRALLALATLTVLLGALLAVGLRYVERWQTLPCAEATREFCAVRGWVVAFFGLAVAPILGFAAWLARLARRIGESGRFPPPGFAVVRDTPVVTGNRARFLARATLALAVLLAAAGLALFGFVWRLVALLAAKSCG